MEISKDITLDDLRSYSKQVSTRLNRLVLKDSKEKYLTELCEEWKNDKRFFILLEVGFQNLTPCVKEIVDNYKNDENVREYLRFLADNGYNIKNKIRARMERYTDILAGSGVKTKLITNYLK